MDFPRESGKGVFVRNEKKSDFTSKRLSLFSSHVSIIASLEEHLQRSTEAFDQTAVHEDVPVGHAPALAKSNRVAEQVRLEHVWLELDALVVLLDLLAELASLSVSREILSLKHQHAVRVQLLEYSLEHELDAVIAVIEVNPFGD